MDKPRCSFLLDSNTRCSAPTILETGLCGPHLHERKSYPLVFLRNPKNGVNLAGSVETKGKTVVIEISATDDAEASKVAAYIAEHGLTLGTKGEDF